MKYLIPILFASTLFSCGSANRHLRKAERHLRLAKELGASFKSDSVVVYDTIISKEIQVDSVWSDPILITDTVPGKPVTITKDRLVIKYIRTGDTVRIQATVKPDTVIVEKKIYVENEIKSGYSLWHLLAAFLAGAGLVAIASFIRR